VVSGYILEEKFRPNIKAIFGVVYDLDPEEIRTASLKEDLKQATDLVLPDGTAIGCRLRRSVIAIRFQHQFLLRAELPTGSKTELDKILSGYGDIYFYGFIDKLEKEIESWFIGDLDVFREVYDTVRPLAQGVTDSNGVRGLAFPLLNFPPEFIIDFNNHGYAKRTKEEAI